MRYLIHQFVNEWAERTPNATALLWRDQQFSYSQLSFNIEAVAGGLARLGISSGDRVAVYLPKQPEAVFSIFGASRADASFVPVNPLLKARQVAYILSHCNVRVLVTSAQRLKLLQEVLLDCPDLQTVVVVDDPGALDGFPSNAEIISFKKLTDSVERVQPCRRIDRDMAAILYTSGSTGNPKGVVLSHRNLVAGAESVASYLENTPVDRILAVLPLSFDAGLSQITTTFSVGASVVLMDYLLPRDVVRAVARYQVTGLAAVPPLWNQLKGLEWPEETVNCLRYITNTGGAMPVATTRSLQQSLPDTKIFLMYGLTEAFRSTYLPPEQVNTRPESMGKAIPNAEILVVNEQGEECAPGEPGELVHRGALVALGYWNDPEKTAERFKPSPGQASEIPTTELAVWSGDQVVRDEDDYLYFVGRKDDMIKTSGYRVSPTEVEEVVYASGLVAGAVALGLRHTIMGQAILLVATHREGDPDIDGIREALIAHCQQELPNFMVPLKVIVRDSLPHNQNGKIDRRSLSDEYQAIFQDGPA